MLSADLEIMVFEFNRALFIRIRLEKAYIHANRLETVREINEFF